MKRWFGYFGASIAAASLVASVEPVSVADLTISHIVFLVWFIVWDLCVWRLMGCQFFVCNIIIN